MNDPKDRQPSSVTGTRQDHDVSRGSEPKNPSRRDAICYLIGGAVAAACPIPSHLFAATAQTATAAPQPGSGASAAAAPTPAQLGSESNEL